MSRTLDRSQGKFEAMPVSDGAPIVESGSNADGEWTRWADGTQTVHKRDISYTAADDILSWPISFISSSTISTHITNDAISAVTSSTNNILTTTWRFLTNATGNTVNMFAIGRWK